MASMSRLYSFPLILTTALISVFIVYKHDAFAYGCHNGMFNTHILGYSLNHQNTMHITFNLIGLWIFSVYTINVYGTIATLIVYVASVVGAAVAYYVQCYCENGTDDIVGASGGICGIIGFALVIAIMDIIDVSSESSTRPPNAIAGMQYILPFSYIINFICLLSYDVFYYIIEGNNTVAHTAHFAGYGCGFVTGCLIVLFDRCVLNG